MEQKHVAWGAASMLLKQHGDRAPAKVAERGVLALAGDNEGVGMGKAIARCMYQLVQPAPTNGTQLCAALH